MLWTEATPEERARLISPLIELVYVDIETKQVTAFKPAPAFRALFNAGIKIESDEPLKEAIVGVGGDGGGPISISPKYSEPVKTEAGTGSFFPGQTRLTNATTYSTI